ncbi:ABC transporter ATP-binding protein [Aliivibrio fischeri]|uniref:ABC transporter ATP-binding protein n=1 Tax=Aliivibrio fischeri TaxID=668 RepID=UPI0012D8F46A|nr:ABC transporter ATP-binding protein [Aliivibrio fischeri]MUI53032.1 ATP-binding cassette domain-containing protein [Aliivibrio fischeri]
MELILKNVRAKYANTEVIKSFNYTFNSGIYVLLGKNGSGKSTLLHAIRNKPELSWQGSITFNNMPINAQILKNELSYLPQGHDSGSALTVEQTLLMGLYNELGFRVNTKQHLRIKESIHLLEIQLGLNNLRHKKIRELSGGQRQLVLLAQCLMKKPKILLLDEPCTYLDIRNQIILINSMQDIKNTIIISTMHEINLAIQHIKNIIILDRGNIAYSGKSNLIEPLTLQQTYEVESVLLEHDNYRNFIFTQIS